MKTAEIVLEYQPLIPGPPKPKKQLYDQACSNDETTIEYWADRWIDNMRANKERFGSFGEHSAGRFIGAKKYQPIIVAGSGPSLKRNAKDLKERGDLTLVSCLHNFHLFEELELNCDFYMSLDAGDVTEEEVYEGGSHPPDWYWEKSKDRTLICYIGTSPKLLEKWQGKVYFFNAPVPGKDFLAKQDEIEKFNFYLSCGGNVLGSGLYFAKAVLGAGSIVFIGADFCFDYGQIVDGKVKHKFHSWDSKYDKELGHTIPCRDIYGLPRRTWPSYWNFKNYFDWYSTHVGGEIINATEGGCLGAYPEGNIAQMRYMDLEDVIDMYHSYEQIEESAKDPKVDYRKILY